MRYTNRRTLYYHRADFGGAGTFCLSVSLLNDKVCAGQNLVRKRITIYGCGVADHAASFATARRCLRFLVCIFSRVSIVAPVSSASMDFNGEPSPFIEHDCDMNRILSLCGAVSLPRWHRLWSQHSFDNDVSSLIDSDDDVSLDIRQISESNSQPGTNGTGWRLSHGAEFVRSNMSTKHTDFESEHTVVKKEETAAETDDSYMVNRTNGVINTNLSSPPPSSKSGQRCQPKPSTIDWLLNRIDFVPVQTDHSVILSTIKLINLFSGRRGYEDDEILARKDFHYDAQSSLSPASQMQSFDVIQQQHHHHHSARPASDKRWKLFGLPDRITVSNHEINMMSPLSF